jgi:hypothetical protein
MAMRTELSGSFPADNVIPVQVSAGGFGSESDENRRERQSHHDRHRDNQGHRDNTNKHPSNLPISVCKTEIGKQAVYTARLPITNPPSCDDFSF